MGVLQMRSWVGCFAILLLASCGGVTSVISGQHVSPASGQVTPATIALLQDNLQAEFDRLGIDPAKVPESVPSGPFSDVFDLEAALVDPDDDGPLPPSGIELTWTEQITGDYDQNGEVNLADITPLGQHFGKLVDYGPPDPPGEPAWWPAGDPDADGAMNWRLARIDGDHNGELNNADVTPIAQHWNEKVSGFCIYHRLGSDGDYELVTAQPGDAMTIARKDALASVQPDPNKPVRCRYLMELSIAGDHYFGLANYDSESGEEGAVMQTCSAAFGVPPVAKIKANIATGKAPLRVIFDASESTDDEGIALYEWDCFGEGTFSESPYTDFALTEYRLGGEFHATVRITDLGGLTDTDSVTISIVGLDSGLYIWPDMEDTDWFLVEGWGIMDGTGLPVDPCLFPSSIPQDFDREYSLVAYDITEDSATRLDPATLTWATIPGFLVIWSSPGTFRITNFTTNYIFATDAG
jgi:hypothetical protein